jgi:hypothetical protein
MKGSKDDALDAAAAGLAADSDCAEIQDYAAAVTGETEIGLRAEA